MPEGDTIHNAAIRIGAVLIGRGVRIRQRGQGDDNRRTYWCPGCQH